MTYVKERERTPEEICPRGFVRNTKTRIKRSKDPLDLERRCVDGKVLISHKNSHEIDKGHAV